MEMQKKEKQRNKKQQRTNRNKNVKWQTYALIHQQLF